MLNREETKPLVSVIVPAFNARATIREALNSALSQTYESIEVVVCDDGSLDGTGELVREIRDPRIVLVSNDRNAGPGASRDAAISVAKGEWLAMLDADDAWHPSRLSTLLQESLEAEIIFDDLLLCHDGIEGLIPFCRAHGEDGFGARGRPKSVALTDYVRSKRLLIQPVIYAPALRATAILHSNRRFAEDAEFFVALCLAGLRLRYVPEALYYYRLTPGSLTTNRSARGEMRNMLEGFLDNYSLPPAVESAMHDKVARLSIDQVGYAALSLLQQKDFLGFLRLAAEAPSTLWALARRVPTRLRYELHRVFSKVPPR